LGVTLDELPAAIEDLQRASALRVEGASTLLAKAGDLSSPVTKCQMAVFHNAIEALREAGLDPAYRHIANSAATVLRPDSHFNMVRPGLALYGLPPVAAVRQRVELKPVMSFKTRIMQIKRVPEGAGVSYGHHFVTRRPSVIGILPV